MADIRPIDANALKLALSQSYNDPESVVDDAPTLDYAPVMHGEWIERKEIFTENEGEVDAIGCSKCGKSQRKFRRTSYCPNCGAKMDGGKENV